MPDFRMTVERVGPLAALHALFVARQAFHDLAAVLGRHHQVEVADVSRMRR
jgi:hypothetical protein